MSLEQELVTNDMKNRRTDYQSLDDVDASSTAPDGYGGSGGGVDGFGVDGGGGGDGGGGPETSARVESWPLVGERNPLMSIFVYCMKQSYVATLIVMMVRHHAHRHDGTSSVVSLIVMMVRCHAHRHDGTSPRSSS